MDFRELCWGCLVNFPIASLSLSLSYSCLEARSVVLTDCVLLDNLQQNVTLNLTVTKSVEMAKLVWGDHIADRYDVVIGADLLYSPEAINPLVLSKIKDITMLIVQNFFFDGFNLMPCFFLTCRINAC